MILYCQNLIYFSSEPRRILLDILLKILEFDIIGISVLAYCTSELLIFTVNIVLNTVKFFLLMKLLLDSMGHFFFYYNFLSRIIYLNMLNADLFLVFIENMSYKVAYKKVPILRNSNLTVIRLIFVSPMLSFSYRI